ncbi:O-antigen ligase family protein [Micromonospora soli]|uniref:O-antigen ligase family protein n=1 Tax=Micromonospora sp. NBRC 110009 TaxID=3061627 RepID=UPI002671E5BD|nr:O-antigen ligase family protein [Micromonospora sp. NBRC 110009]WKT98872.1 O-antigen ligase family protein [Micromonospora sp. NBRC 110009]
MSDRAAATAPPLTGRRPAAGSAASGSRPAVVPPLPVWPLTVMFALMPLWWALGAFYLGWSVFGAVLLALLVARGRVPLPAGTACWLLFLALVLLSATRLDRATAYLTFGLRYGFLATALVVGVYAHTLVREGAPWDRVLRPLGWYWLGLVALGWLAVLAPTLSLTTPVELALPHGISAQRYIQALTHVRVNEFNPVSRTPIYRTAAPYPYTNNWGTAYALLVPCVLAYLTSVRTGRFRTVLWVSLPLSVVPAFLTLNRGMFVGLGAGLLYLGLRALLRGNARLIVSIAALVLLVWIVSLVVPVQDMINARVSTTDTNVDRMDLYVRTWQAVEQSPLLGYGAPKSVDTTLAEEPLGTQGLIWQILYSHGIPALVVFLSWLVLVARRLTAAVSPAGYWLSTVPVIALVVIPVYAYIDPNLSLIFFGVGAGLAAVAGPVNRAAVGPSALSQPAPLTPWRTRGFGRAAVPGRRRPSAKAGVAAVPLRTVPAPAPDVPGPRPAADPSAPTAAGTGPDRPTTDTPEHTPEQGRTP